jgi:hypothetical protein
VFGGPAWPVGWAVGFAQRPLEDVYPVMRAWRHELRLPKYRYRELDGVPIVDQLLLLPSLQQPPKKELIVATSSDWTAHFDNSILGGDPVAWVGYLSSRLDCQGVIAVHIPRGQYPMPATRFELLGPAGEKPLRYVRTVTAGIYDEGRWQFEAWGVQQPFEEPAAYSSRLIRERLTRAMLLRYLLALGLDADEPSFYGDGVLIETRAPFRPRTLTLDDARREYAASGN